MDNDLSSAVYAALGAFALNIIFCPIIIPKLAQLKFGQYVRSDGPAEHLKKAGTPTMGGLVIILSFVLISMFFIGPHSESMALVLVTLGFGVIGFIDDYIKVVLKRSLGLRAWQKMLGQILITAVFAVYLTQLRQSPGQTEIYVPFLSKPIDLGVLYVPFLFVVM
ncbi:MAG: phospho-N-acetylmuramoyl-pentapeptide-transferase, partial [Clostridiales bacterium]|nr:phospho-N-acetylmuramoyl-pentapeptide-transferase [Clostridiales bacterium]